jgi:hypothetical protein
MFQTGMAGEFLKQQLIPKINLTDVSYNNKIITVDA